MFGIVGAGGRFFAPGAGAGAGPTSMVRVTTTGGPGGFCGTAGFAGCASGFGAGALLASLGGLVNALIARTSTIPACPVR
jgi:hypothetical protein